MKPHSSSPALSTLFALAIALASTGAFAIGQTPSTPPSAPQPAPAKPSPDPITVAVLDFECRIPGAESAGAEVSLLLATFLSSDSRLILVERTELEKLLSEQELSASGLVTPETAVRIGRITGAKVLVTGRLFASGNETLMVAKVMGTETTRVFGEMIRSPIGESNRVTPAESLAERIATTVVERKTDLLARDEPRAERDARLVEQLAGWSIPDVWVKVSEQHIGAAALDPAVETELVRRLRLASVEVHEQATPSEVRITGAAFSEVLGRRGKLVAVRGRVELKAVEASTGRVLFASCQSEIAVGLGEMSIGKVALERATTALSERLLVALRDQVGRRESKL